MEPQSPDADAYCRQIEAYLCRKNDGHLVRVVGPAFALVNGWWNRGIPLKVACRGIDRYVERYYAKGPRRRPVRIEFCDADVLDVFDEWRRALGLGMAGIGAAPGAVEGDEGGTPPPATAAGEVGSKGGGGLRAHLDRVVTRLTDLQARGGLPADVADAIESLIERLGAYREASRTARGDARRAILTTLSDLDAELLAAGKASTPAEVLGALREEAGEDLAGFRERMSPEAYERALSAATGRLLRERLKLPVIAYEQG